MSDDRTLRILLVEDDVQLLDFAAHTLRTAGHSVLVASSAEAARAHLDAGSIIDCVVTDVVLPGATGIELVESLMIDRPHLPVLFMTGRTDTEVREAIAATGHPLLPKPYQARDLREAVAALPRPDACWS